MVTSLQVLAITEDLHDVHTLGKEAAAVHRSLMKDLSKVSMFYSLFFSSFLYEKFVCLVSPFFI